MIKVFWPALVVMALAQSACTDGDPSDAQAAPRDAPVAGNSDWLSLAEAGDARAQYNVGLMYRTGDGMAQDDRQALIWFEKAATQGLVVAQSRVGWMYANGVGTRRDLPQGIRWTALAAQQGDANAKSNLGQMQSALADAHMVGSDGLAKSRNLAYLWHDLAADNGIGYSAAMRDSLTNLLTAQDIKRAKAEAGRCLATTFADCGSRL